MKRFLKIACSILLIQAFTFDPGPVAAQSSGVKSDNSGGKTSLIGVLAFRGVEAAISYWQPLADYLTKSVAGQRFELTPVTLNSVYQHIENKRIDFLITNPGHYVVLADRFGLSAISTRERINKGSQNLLEYGSVIFVHSDSKINGLDGLKGTTIAAVSPDAFGGFQIAWAEMEAQGIDVFDDLEGIRYMGFPQDAIVSAVQNKEVQAGIVRTGLLEKLAEEGRLNIEDLRVLNGNNQIDYPYRISSKLYPEWPFAALPGVDSLLKIDVLKSLLDTQNAEIASKHQLSDIWSTPLSYNRVRMLTTAYNDQLDQKKIPRINILGLDIIHFTLGITAIIAIAGTILYYRRQKTFDHINTQTAVISEQADLDGVKDKFAMLTQREREILVLVCSGNASKTIAKQLNISVKTVEFHRTNLLQKTEAGTTAHLVQMATRLDMDQGFPPV